MNLGVINPLFVLNEGIRVSSFRLPEQASQLISYTSPEIGSEKNHGSQRSHTLQLRSVLFFRHDFVPDGHLSGSHSCRVPFSPATHSCLGEHGQFVW